MPYRSTIVKYLLNRNIWNALSKGPVFLNKIIQKRAAVTYGCPVWKAFYKNAVALRAITITIHKTTK
jgi:hypothetical protein